MVLILSDKREFVGHPVHELNSTPNTTLESLAGVGKEISDKCHSDPELLAECVIGASLKEQYINLFAEAGYIGIKELRSFDYFSGSSSKILAR